MDRVSEEAQDQLLREFLFLSSVDDKKAEQLYSTDDLQPSTSSSMSPLTPLSPVAAIAAPMAGPTAPDLPHLLRNHYSEFTLQLDSQSNHSNEKRRIYIADTCAHAGNFKRLKTLPEADEDALILYAKVDDGNGTRQNLVSCPACQAYYNSDDRRYFARNPMSRNRLLLIKRRAVTYFTNGEFQIHCKMMCTPSHHRTETFSIEFAIVENLSGACIMQASQQVMVRQWAKGSWSSATVNIPVASVPQVPGVTIYNHNFHLYPRNTGEDDIYPELLVTPEEMGITSERCAKMARYVEVDGEGYHMLEPLEGAVPFKMEQFSSPVSVTKIGVKRSADEQ